MKDSTAIQEISGVGVGTSVAWLIGKTVILTALGATVSVIVTFFLTRYLKKRFK